MFQLDYASGLPICDQVVNGIIRLKALGVLSGGDQLPSVRALASQLAVNPNTVQKAYGILETSGVICSVKGKGSFLADDDRAHRAILDSAEKSFRAAVSAALELGLTKEELIALIGSAERKDGNV